MKVILKNSKLVFQAKEEEKVLELNVLSLIEYAPAHPAGTKEASGAFRGYYVDLAGLYEQGYRKVRFKGQSYINNTDDIYNISPGIVCTSPMPATGQSGNETPDTVESSIPASNVKTPQWFELPLTPDSKCLHGSYCFDNYYVAGFEVWTPVNGDAQVSNYSVAK